MNYIKSKTHVKVIGWKEHGHCGVSFSVVLTIGIDIEILKNYILKTEVHETKSTLKVIGRNALRTDLHFERESSPKSKLF